MEKPTKPVPPEPNALPAEHHKYAQDSAVWSDWIKDHPEDDVNVDPAFPVESGESGAQ